MDAEVARRTGKAIPEIVEGAPGWDHFRDIESGIAAARGEREVEDELMQMEKGKERRVRLSRITSRRATMSHH